MYIGGILIITFNVVHLSTGHAGGAGLAARRLNAALNEVGVPSTFYALESKDFTMAANEFAISRNPFARILSGVVVRAQAKLSSKILFSLISTRAISEKKILALAKTRNTVFHLHNWYNLIPESQIFALAKNGFPVVVTLHDQRLLTGGCHYTFDCTKFTNGCSKCPTIRRGLKWVPAYVVNKRKNFLAGIPERPWLTYVSPSNWILSEAAKSNSSDKVPNVFIPNVLGPSFKNLNQDGVGNLSEKLQIGIASMDPNSYVKGGDIVLELSSMAQEINCRFELLYLRDFSSSPEKIEAFWNQVDYLLVSSRADNSPNVIHEAHHHRVPVIASQVGGIPELLTIGFDHTIPLEKMTAYNLSQYLHTLSSSDFRISSETQLESGVSSYSKGAIQAQIDLYSSFFTDRSSGQGNENEFRK